METGTMENAPIIIAHRGFSGQRPEHTRAAYELAITQGADYVEPDVVATADGALVIRHENEISGTTDIADRPEFADRRTIKTVDGVRHDGWFTEDFTVAELKTLRALERIPQLRPQNTAYNGEAILTFDELLQLVAQANQHRERKVGVYVETKHPTYFDSLGWGLNDMLIDELEARDANAGDPSVVIQSFETTNLRQLRSRTPAFLVQLMSPSGAPADLIAQNDSRTYVDLASADGLDFVADYADGIGPNKTMVLARNTDDSLGESTGLVGRAHAAGLDVHIWTMRDENQFLPADLRWGDDPADYGNIAAESWMYWDEGVDGVFADSTTTAVVARRDWIAGHRPMEQ